MWASYDTVCDGAKAKHGPEDVLFNTICFDVDALADCKLKKKQSSRILERR